MHTYEICLTKYMKITLKLRVILVLVYTAVPRYCVIIG
eukprot:COSAG03_NODE_23791_length_277_cov_0.578652_1_plen_37_part_01